MSTMQQSPQSLAPVPVALTVAIVTYQREQVLLDTLAALLALDPSPQEVLLVDQTPAHEPRTDRQLQAWQQQGSLRWIRLSRPSVTAAMNRALQEARGQRVLFVDDDVRPSPALLHCHQQAGTRHPGALIAGRVLQPWNHGVLDGEDRVPFRWNTATPRSCQEFIGCNFSVPRLAALELGGFDENFERVAYRYEAEFAHRWRSAGHPIRYEPTALLEHLHAQRGGTRSYGDHRTTIQPDHALGRYYGLLRTEPLPRALVDALAALLRSLISRHHLRQPWWIPLTLIAELRGLAWALRLNARGPRLPGDGRPRLLIATSHPIQYQAPLFQAIEQQGQLASEVLFLTLPDAMRQGVGFGVAFQWDQPLLEAYRWRLAVSQRGDGDLGRFNGLWLARPWRELLWGPAGLRPDAVLITGWQCLGLLQLLLAARLLRIPVLLRIESNPFRRRPWPVRLWHRFLVHQAKVCLTIGEANTRFYRRLGVPENRLIPAPYFVDNHRFASFAEGFRPQRASLRQRWTIPEQAFCFLFAGKLQPKKRPLVLLEALELLCADPHHPPVHLLIVGSGELEQACREQVLRAGLPVSFAGFLNQGEIPAAYAVADALVLPSDSGETWGLVVNEAMACGLPAIVSDQVGCGPDLVEHGRTGFVFPLDDAHSLAGQMARLARDSRQAGAMGKRARERVLKNYTVMRAAAAVASSLSF